MQNEPIEVTLMVAGVLERLSVPYLIGGSLASALNQTNATFAVPGVNLGVGLHPFYAIVTAANGASIDP